MAALESRSKSDHFRDKIAGLLLLLLESLTKPDESGQLVLTSEEKGVFEKLKMAIDSFKRLRDDSREGDPNPEGGGDGSGKAKNQVMVNVVIQK